MTTDPPPEKTAAELATEAFTAYFITSGNTTTDTGFAVSSITPTADL